MARISISPKPGIGAKLYFTEFNTSLDYGGRVSMEFSGIINHTEGSHAIMRALMNGGGVDILQERNEWCCTWCASPNPIEHRHCSQCGGPRGWIL